MVAAESVSSANALATAFELRQGIAVTGGVLDVTGHGARVGDDVLLANRHAVDALHANDHARPAELATASLVLVHGEPGSGRSRLARQLSPLEQAEHDTIARVLAAEAGNQARAAACLGIRRNPLYQRIRQLGIPTWPRARQAKQNRRRPATRKIRRHRRRSRPGWPVWKRLKSSSPTASVRRCASATCS